METFVVDFDPAIFKLGAIQVRWYGLMYVVGFLVGVKILAHLGRKNFLPLAEGKADVVMTYLLVGMFIGARLFYVVIYNWEQTNSFLDVIAVWRGGLSFHGAAVGYIVATYIFTKRHNLGFHQLMDAIVLCTPQGLFWGRLGNFINGELYGRVTDSPLGVIFASDPERLVRHPSQIYQSLTEGLLLMGIVWWVKSKAKRYGVIGPSFLIGYGLLRYFVEFFREADPQMGYYLGGTTTMGQILCLIMASAGAVILFYNLKNGAPIVNPTSSVKNKKKQKKK